MKKLSILTVVLMLIALTSTVVAEGEKDLPKFNLSAHGGVQLLLEKPMESAYGEGFTFGGEFGFDITKNIEIAVAFDYMMSGCDCVLTDMKDLDLTHFRGGLYYNFNPYGINPRIGAGVDFANADYDVWDFDAQEIKSYEDSGVGFYVSAAVEFPVSKSLKFGVEAIYSMVEIGYDEGAFPHNNYGWPGENGNGLTIADQDCTLLDGSGPDVGGLTFLGFVKLEF